jgi:hypothetical protein
VSLLTNQKELGLQMKFKDHLLKNPFLLRGAQPFVLFRPAIDWLNLTHIVEGQSSLLKVHSDPVSVNLTNLGLKKIGKITSVLHINRFFSCNYS